MTRGESSLPILLATMRPVLQEGSYAFCLLPAGRPVPPDAFASIVEDEGRTVIVPLDSARRAELAPLHVAACVTLSVHSDLEAVGFLAAVTAALASAGISCNVIAAVHHDHLFVPVDRAAETLQILSRLSDPGIQ